LRDFSSRHPLVLKAEGNFILNRIGKKMVVGILKNISHLPAQFGNGYSFRILTANSDLASNWF
jgi:hypothetical protein